MASGDPRASAGPAESAWLITSYTDPEVSWVPRRTVRFGLVRSRVSGSALGSSRVPELEVGNDLREEYNSLLLTIQKEEVGIQCEDRGTISGKLSHSELYLALQTSTLPMPLWLYIFFCYFYLPFGMIRSSAFLKTE